MSIPPSNQDMGELPSPNMPLPEPNLNFTVQVHSLLNGESPAINSPDNNIPGAPVSVLETSSHDDNNSAPGTRDGNEAGNTNTTDEADTTSGQGGADTDETSNNDQRPVGDVDAESVQQFVNLDIEQQAETLIRYQQHLSQVVHQNNQMAEMIDKINADCQGLTTQVETALKQNADLLKTLKETPSVETITSQVKDTLDKEYELKFKNLEDQLVQEKQVQEKLHQDNLNKKPRGFMQNCCCFVLYFRCLNVFCYIFIKVQLLWLLHSIGPSPCTVPKYRAAVDYTPRLRAPRNLPRCTANSDTREAVANHSLGSATANSYLGTTST